MRPALRERPSRGLLILSWTVIGCMLSVFFGDFVVAYRVVCMILKDSQCARWLGNSVLTWYFLSNRQIPCSRIQNTGICFNIHDIKSKSSLATYSSHVTRPITFKFRTEHNTSGMHRIDIQNGKIEKNIYWNFNRKWTNNKRIMNYTTFLT